MLKYLTLFCLGIFFSLLSPACIQAKVVEINLVDDEPCLTIDGSLTDIENAYPGYQWT